MIIFFISVTFVTSGARIQISWDVKDQAPSLFGSLRIQNKNAGGSITINDKLDLTLRKLQWKVSVSPGTYMFAINDGTGEKFSDEFQVVQGIPVGCDNVGGANVGKGRSVNQVNNDKGMINENSKSVGQKSSHTSSQDIPKSQVPMSLASMNSATPTHKFDAVMMNSKAGLLLSLGAIVTFLMQFF
ncbi:hypothetical protein F8M41_024746 [Gigaspora margarita]|uniref:Uncharacterized protein n=1 Tax=Gigaspora margarita TaxID=4874 RepID=A0A8H4AAD8_GIGMA|nr:hypothetical protein F8M41_024746 [Gigaspora margarita]